MSTANEIESRGGSVRYRSLDVTNLDDVKTFADFAEAEFGRLDVTVNNAGVMRSRLFQHSKSISGTG
jgi:NAD(P)-dependent dehydrogenase (short-subunit alcohol dehydrogenase family)